MATLLLAVSLLNVNQYHPAQVILVPCDSSSVGIEGDILPYWGTCATADSAIPVWYNSWREYFYFYHFSAPMTTFQSEKDHSRYYPDKD